VSVVVEPAETVDVVDTAKRAAKPEDLRAADGRVPGRRGRATRQRLLECTAEMLRTTSYRSMKVIDIAREAGTSPATFYQYFADVEAAILVLAQEMAADGERLVRLVAEGNWKGRAGYRTALELTDAFFEFWDQHRPVLRVVDLSTDEGDRRFRNIRVRLLNAVTTELAAVIAAFQAEGKNLGVEPMAQAGTLVTTLANVAAHHRGFEFWGIRTADVRISVARQVYWGTTAQRPPTPS
jgi:AcrR family transcriptional regulator